MGTNQHLIRSICAIRAQGGIDIGQGETIMPDPILVGRNDEKLKALAARTGVEKWTTDLSSALTNPEYSIYFDAQTTLRRFEDVKKAINAGKHIYCEKPIAQNSKQGQELFQLANQKGLKTGVVADKLWLGGLMKLKNLLDQKKLGRILSVRIEFGYWVFEGDRVEAQRPSWNYRKKDGGGIILDMLCHFSYVLESLIGRVSSISCLGTTHIPQRVDEQGEPYQCTAEDAFYATLQLEGNVTAHINASWCVRVRRDDLITVQVDGTEGTAVTGLSQCWIQPYDKTPRSVWNPDIAEPLNSFAAWQEVDPKRKFDNAFKIQWELFLRHVVCDEPFEWNILAGSKNILLAEKAIESWQTRRWIDIPKLNS